MRILQLIPVFSAPFGGPVTVVRSISKELAKRHEVTVYTTSALDQRSDFKNNPSEDWIDGYRVVYFPRILSFSGFNISPTMKHALEQTISDFDVIHLHSFRHFQDMIVCHYAKKYDIPYTLQVHAALSRASKSLRKWSYDTLFGHRVLKEASRVIAISEAEVEQYKQAGVPKNKIVLVPNGIDLSKCTALPAKGTFKSKYQIAENKRTILCLGRVHEAKGIGFLIKAFALLNRNGFDDSVLIIAGPDDGYVDKARQLLKSLEISDKAVFTGLLSETDKINAYTDADVVVNVEPRNVFGLVPLEAAACSTPVVVSKSNAISTIVSQGNFGFSVKYGDTTELADIMKKMLTNDDLLLFMGQKGRNFVFDNHNWANIVSKLESVYKEIVHSENVILHYK